MFIDIFHHFQVQPTGLGFGVSNLVIGELKCLILFILVGILLRLKVGGLPILFNYIFRFIQQIGVENFGDQSKKFTKILLFLFLFILFGNLYSLIPGQFAFNSHLIVTGCWSLMVLIYCIIKAIYLNPKAFFSQFIPSGVPFFVLVVMIPMKIMSFLLSPVSLALRLFINVMVGHIIMTVAESFAKNSIIGSISAVIALVLITFLELFVSILQAYIFLVMSANMLKSCIIKSY